MSFFNMFKPQTNNTTATPNANNPAPKPSGITDGMHGVPSNNQQPQGQQQGQTNQQGQANQQPQTPANPLDAFNGMFDNSNTEADKPPSFFLPKDTLDTVARGQNFVSGIDNELMTKALSGDAQSLVDVINATAQNAYKASMDHMSGLSDRYVNNRLDFDNKSFGNKVKEQLTTAELSNNTPGFNHPVVKAQLSSVAKDLAKKNPDASPQEIATMARSYITQLAQAINPQSDQTETKSAGNTNWDEYFG